MPSCASEISPPDRSGPGYTRRQALTGHPRLRPGRRAASFPPRGGRAARGGGGAHPGLPDTGRGSCWQNPFSSAGSGTEPGGSPLPALTLPAAEGKGGPSRRSRRRRRRPSRCSSAAGVTAANGAASAGAGGPRSGAEPPPPASAQPPRREGGGWQVRGHRLPGVGLGQAALPPLSPAALCERPEGNAAGRSPRFWGPNGALLPASSKTPGPSLQPQRAGDCRYPTRSVKEILKCFGCRI